MAQRVKCLPAMRETRIRFLGWEDPLEKETATHSSTLAGKIPWMEQSGRYSPWGHKESEVYKKKFKSLIYGVYFKLILYVASGLILFPCL